MRSFDRRLNPRDTTAGFVGDTKTSIRTASHGKWVLLNGDTLGSASSGATLASEIYRDLYILFWDSMLDAQAPVSTGRGASGAADFDANKTLTMPDARGRTVRGTGTGAGLTARTHGDTAGVEDTVVATHGHADSFSVDSDSHDHPLRTGTEAGTFFDNTNNDNILSRESGNTIYSLNTDSPSNASDPGVGADSHSHVLSGAVTAAGVSPTDENASPWLALNWFIRY